MSINIEKIRRLNELVGLAFKRKHIIVLDPAQNKNSKDNIEEDIVYDKADWKMTDELNKYVKDLSNESNLSIEDKILSIYEKICKDYVYDDNLISYIQKIDDDVFDLPDWYGRDIDQEWENNREQHNRRICFELSRYLAKDLSDLVKNNDDYDTCILWNKNLTHYFVGLTCENYSVALDLDDFFNIKDLTRLKTDLTAEGIFILEDKDDKFKNSLDKFNSGRSKHAISKISNEINKINSMSNQNKTEMEENEDLNFFEKVLKVLSENYDIDSQGIYEYMKEIVDIRLGSESREKIWKKINGETLESTRYIRCLLLDINEKKYLVDVEKREIRLFDEKELKEKRTKYVPYKELSRGGYDYYDGK